MGVRLMPLTLAHLCAHALELECRAAARYDEYAHLLRAWGANLVADAFEELGKLQQQELRALEAGAREQNRSDPTLWEHAWQLALSPEALEATQPFVPRNVRHALQVVVAVERRAESYYADVAGNARDAVVRDCAAEMSEHKRKRLELLEYMLACEHRTRWVYTPSQAAEALDVR